MSESNEPVRSDGAEANESAETTSTVTADEFAFSPEREEQFRKIVERYPTALSAIMPTLWLCQDEWGWLKPGVPEWVAKRLDLPVASIYEVITFYTMYYTENPGKYNLQVCRNVSCHLMGARKIIGHLEQRLGLKHGETDEDGLFRLEEVECLGACGMAPMMQVGKHYYENLTPEKVDELLEQWRRDG